MTINDYIESIAGHPIEATDYVTRRELHDIVREAISRTKADLLERVYEELVEAGTTPALVDEAISRAVRREG